MSAKIGADHLARAAGVYVRQSTMTQVLGNPESRARQYALTEAAVAVHGSETARLHQAAIGGAV